MASKHCFAVKAYCWWGVSWGITYNFETLIAINLQRGRGLVWLINDQINLVSSKLYINLWVVSSVKNTCKLIL